MLSIQMLDDPADAMVVIKYTGPKWASDDDVVRHLSRHADLGCPMATEAFRIVREHNVKVGLSDHAKDFVRLVKGNEIQRIKNHACQVSGIHLLKTVLEVATHSQSPLSVHDLRELWKAL